MVACLRRNFFIWQRRLRHSFVTTPIFYVNSGPHIGHLYSAVLADAVHRWESMKSPNDVHIFSTGTDEHGSKIERAAALSQRTPIEHCDMVSAKFAELFDRFDISYTDYIRTTEDRHKRAVAEVWTRLMQKGYLYKDKYKGWYSIVDECFYKDTDIERITQAGNEINVAKATRNSVEWVEETNYMFRLSEFKERTKRILEAGIINPAHYQSLALREVEACGDLSVSRDSSRIKWGIEVPGEPSQRIYVWLDALTNYLTVNGFPDQLRMPAPSCQVIGKDIIRFHTVYWLAFLQALELPLPQKLAVHGHWLVDNSKMSKSVGNVVDPFLLSNLISSDGVRYFLLKQGVPTDDCNFLETKAVDLINSDLVNTIGNLLQRSTVVKLNPEQICPNLDLNKLALSATGTRLANEIFEELDAMIDRIQPHYDSMYFYRGIETLLVTVRKTNQFFQETAPWKLDDSEQVLLIFGVVYEVLRIVSILLTPMTPKLADHILTRLSIESHKRTLDSAKLNTQNSMKRYLGKDNGVFLNRVVYPK